MFKVTFTWRQGNPCGGGTYITSRIVMFDATLAKDLNEKIDCYIKEKSNSYVTNMAFDDITRL